MSQLEAGLSDDLRRLVIERSHDLVTCIDPEGVILYASPSWRTMLGYEPDEVVGTPLTRYCHPDDLERGVHAIATQADGASIEPIVTRRLAKDGRWLSVESNSTPVVDAEGNVTSIIGSARDVTEREELRRRLSELNALYAVADAVARTAASLDELFEEALDALIDATAADRASLLLFDNAGVMRFRASRGLSDAYRSATEGHSPWTQDAVNPAPVLVASRADGAFEPWLDEVLAAEGIEALAFVPIVHAGRLLGKFMLYADAPHAWDDREVRLALTISNHLGSATVRTSTGAELRASRTQLETIMATVDEGILVQSPEGRWLYSNDGAARAVGFETAEAFLSSERRDVLGKFDILDEDGDPIPPDELPGRIALSGRTAERLILYKIRETGEEKWSLVRANPIRDEQGNVVAAVSVIHDITEQRRRDREVREASNLVEGVFGNAPVGLAFWDRDFRYVRANPAIAAMEQLPLDELIGRTLFEITPEVEPTLRPLLERVQATGEPLLNLDIHSRRLWQASFFPVGDAGGIGGVIEDVTAVRRADARVHFLARAGDLLNQTLDSAETLGALAEVAVPDFAGHVTVDVFVGGELRCVGARHIDEEKTQLMIDLRQTYPPTVEGHPVQRALRSGRPQIVHDVQAEARTMAHDEQHAAAIAALGNESGIVVPLIARGRTFGAITFGTVPPQRPFDEADAELAFELGVRASVALDNALLFEQAQARAHAADALQFVDDGVFLVDHDDIVRLWNPAAARTFRTRAERALGRHVSESVAEWDVLRERMAGGRRTETIPLNVKGEERWISLSAAEFSGGTVYAFRDVTQEHAIEQLRSDFVSTVSHELRTPLAAIYGAALTLQRNDVRLEESQREGLLDVISSEADRLARIVNDILWASRLDSGQMGMAIESCDAEALATQVVGALRTHTPAEVALAVDAEPGLPPVAADPDKLRQVLTNLLDNAVKYSPEGGHVYVLVTRSGNRIRFRVQDEGLGVPVAEQSRIFEKFFRLDPDMTRGVGGTGLGLYICRELVQRMHGRIGVTSDGRSGSTFWVELPVAG